MNVSYVNFGRGYRNLQPEIDMEMQRVLAKGDLILREDVERFEETLAKYVGTKYAIAVSSGTDAIMLSIRALGITGGVVVPSHTFKSTAGAVKSAGAILLISDMDGTVDIPHFEAIIPVHIAGELAEEKVDATVIEDACQALGAVKNPTTNAQCWSFYPAKILGAFGDGGAVTTNDENVYNYIKEARNHFKGTNEGFGGNYRMDNLQAAVLNVKFKYIDLYLERRKKIAELYLDFFKDLPFALPNNTDGRVWQDFIIRTDKRDELYDFLKREGVETMKNEYPWTSEYPKLPLAAQYEAETLRLPCNPEMMEDEQEYVIEKVTKFYENM